MDDRISELPDCILSDILKMLPMKDLVKTSILSKKWYTLWALRVHLCYDIFNVLGNLNELLQNQYLIDVCSCSSAKKRGFYFPSSSDTLERYVNLDMSRGEFVQRVDQFVKKFLGTKIDSFLVNFCLDNEQNNIIDQWISFAVARGVERVDLLFLGRPYAPLDYCIHRNPYKLDFALFSVSNASSLSYLRLENCIVCHPTNYDFIQFKNLRSLSLEEVKLDETFIESLLSNCPQLKELCLLTCEFKSSMPVIASSSLCHLKVIGCYFLSNDHNRQLLLNLISLHCLKLTSLELGCIVLTSSKEDLDTLDFTTPMLKSIGFSISMKQVLNSVVSRCATFFPKLEIMHVTTFSMVSHKMLEELVFFFFFLYISLSFESYMFCFVQATTSLQTTQPFKHLQQLNLIIFVDSYILDDVEYDPLWILNIIQTSPLLQKLSVMVSVHC